MWGRANARHPAFTSGEPTVKTLVLAAAKGGVGKTTLSAALAVAASLCPGGPVVAVMDLDPQGSLTAWWNARTADDIRLATAGASPLRPLQAELGRDGVDLLVIDCPPSFSSLLRRAICAADLVLMPCGASPLDLGAVASTAAMAERAGVPYGSVLNRAVFRSRIAGDGVRVLSNRRRMVAPPVHQRVAIPAAMAEGLTALETEPGGAAARELLILWDAVRSVLLGAL